MIFELITVFLGVYSAILVSDYQDRQKLNQARVDYFNTFLSELENYESSATRLEKKISEFLLTFDEALNEGNKPTLIAHNLIFYSNTFIIGAAFEGDKFSAIGTTFLSSISRGTSLIKVIQQKITLYNQNCHQLLYFQLYDTERFYREDGKMFDHLQWYTKDLQEIQQLLSVLIKIIQEGAMPETSQLIQKYSPEIKD